MTETNDQPETDNTRRDIAAVIRTAGKPAAALLAAVHPIAGTAMGFAAEFAAGLVENLGVSKGLQQLEHMAKNPVPYIKQADLDAQTERVISELENE